MREIPRIGAELAGYRLESLVSRGGMAVVYLADHLRLGRKVALKILAVELAEDDSFRERFLRESRAAAALDHPNVVPIYDAGEAEGLLYIAMRYVHGTDLRGLLVEEGPLDLDRTVSIATQVASALEAAHREGLVHRDVKPGNILLVPRDSPQVPDHVYLADFGLAKHRDSMTGLTATGEFMGTVSYVAPEQIEGGKVDGRTDVYALGCVLFECVTGTPPFRKDDEVAVLWAHVREQPPSLEELRVDAPAGLSEVVATALAKSPDERYQSCAEFAAAIRGFSASAQATVVPSRVTGAPADRAASAARPSGAAGEAEPSGEAVPSATREQAIKPTRRAALVVAIAFLAGGAAVGGLLALTGGGESRTVYEELVLPFVPGQIRPTCKEVRQPADVLGGTGGTAACTALNGRIKVSYTKVSARQWLFDSFFAVADRELGTNLAANHFRAPSGSCAEGRGWNYWHPSSAAGAAHVEGLPRDARGGTRPLAEHGRLVCFRRGGEAVVEWIDPSSELYGIAASGIGPAPLMSWWRTQSGPRGDVTRSPGGTGGGGTGGGTGRGG